MVSSKGRGLRRSSSWAGHSRSTEILGHSIDDDEAGRGQIKFLRAVKITSGRFDWTLDEWLYWCGDSDSDVHKSTDSL